MIGYIHTQKTLPSKVDQMDALGHCDALYSDAGRNRTDRVAMVRAAVARGETIRLATAAVLGSGDELRAVLRALAGKGVVLHVLDTDVKIPITDEAVALMDLPEATSNEIIQRRARCAGLAAAGKSGRKPITTPEQDLEILRRLKKQNPTEIAAVMGLSYATVNRRIKAHNEKETDRD